MEKTEKQWNAQLARGFIIVLPRELPQEQYEPLIREYCQQQFVSNGMIADYAIHDKGDGNPHAHLMLTMRAMDEKGNWLPKARKIYDIDEHGNKIKLPSGNYKSHKENTVDWNDPGKAEIWRTAWADLVNLYLERAERPERIDLRSYARQGKEEAPTIHLGPAVTQMEKRGIETNMGNLNRDIKRTNRALLAIRKLIAELQSWLAELIEKRDKIVEEMREPTIPELLMQYMDDRRDERSEWSVSGQRKGTNMDLKKVSHAIAFLQEHEIATTEDLQKHLDKKEAAFSDLDNTIRGKEKRLRDVQALVKASDSAERLLPIQHQYAAIGWKSKKEKFYQEHKVEIDEYNKALRLLYKFYPDRKIPNRTLKAELKELSDDLEALNKELAAIKADLDELRFVRNCITPREDINEEENLTIEAKQAPKEKASLIDRLHDKQQIADEQKQKGKSHSHGYEKDYER